MFDGGLELEGTGGVGNCSHCTALGMFIAEVGVLLKADGNQSCKGGGLGDIRIALTKEEEATKDGEDILD